MNKLINKIIQLKYDIKEVIKWCIFLYNSIDNH